MGFTIGAMLEEIQGLYQQHHQPCFLYLSSEVIKVSYPGRKKINVLLVIFCFIVYYKLKLVHLLLLMLQIFGSDPSCANYLKSLIEALFMHTTHLLTSIQVRFHLAVIEICFKCYCFCS